MLRIQQIALVDLDMSGLAGEDRPSQYPVLVVVVIDQTDLGDDYFP